MTVNGTEYTESTDKTPDEAPESTPKPDYDALAAKVRSKMAVAFGDEEPVEDDDDPVEEDEPVEDEDEPVEDEEEPVEEDEPADDEPVDDEEEPSGEEEDAQVAAAEEGDVDPNAPTLPDPYRRSLKARGWTDEDIDQNLTALGDRFLNIAANIHQSRNDELATFAAAGRQARQQSQQPASQPEPSTDSTSPSGEFKVPSPVDGDALKKNLRDKYGDDEMLDELVDSLLNPVNGAIEAVNAIVPSLQQGQQAATQAANDQAVKEVEAFFADESLAPYKELYGDEQKGPLTQQQVDNRNEVLDQAFSIKLGAEQLRGQRLSVAEAMRLAHELVSKDYKETAVRRKITKQAKKRTKGITLKPGKSKGGPSSSETKPATRSELEKATRKRLQKVFG